ncbi:MAG: cytochrome, partial [Tardiphaga sp.]|nr:cytochrome [Tardiphaga sp.]
GIYTGHPTMPAFQLEADQINDLLAYLKTLE